MAIFVRPYVNEKPAFSKIFTMDSAKRYVFSDSFHLIHVDLRPRIGEKISVFKQKRILVDGTLETLHLNVL